MLYECIPNISLGQNPDKIGQLQGALLRIDGLIIGHMDSGYDANRTVLTLFGHEQAIGQAIDVLFDFALQHIDMRTFRGEHPCIGAVDVLPIVPFYGYSKLEVDHFVRRYALQIAERMNMPVYLYDRLASSPVRQKLSHFRRGGIAAASERCHIGEMSPDYGPPSFHAQLGASCFAAREMMVAFNINISVTTLPVARAIASDFMRQRDDQQHFIACNPMDIVNFEQLTSVRFLAWYMDEYATYQLSTNIYDTKAISMTALYRWVDQQLKSRWAAEARGSELIGMAQLSAIANGATLDNIAHYVSELKLNAVKPFVAKERIIELVLGH